MSLIPELLLVFLIAFALTALWLAVALQRQWFDHPNFRSAHATPVPKSGGVGFVIVFSLYTCRLWAGGTLALPHLLALNAALVLAATGMLDDFRNLSIRIRLTVQLLVATSVVLMLDPPLELVLPWGTFNADMFTVPLLVLGFVWLVNLYNFMDGIDSLAAAECIFICLALAWFGGMGDAAQVYAPSLGLAVAVTGFLYFNLPGAKLFMGDLGSNFLGLVLGVLSLMALKVNVVNVWTILVLFSIFLLDSTITLTGRMRAGLVWYHGHNSHAYQKAAAAFSSHGRVVAGITLINLFWVFPSALLTVRFADYGFMTVTVCWLPLMLLWLYCRGLGTDKLPGQPGAGLS
jgi:Fuc2NAc and GlcNAc transferase